MQLSATVIHDCFVREMRGEYELGQASGLPIPSFINAAATRAANFYFPINEAQYEAQQAIYQALREDDLGVLFVALRDAARLTTDWWRCEWRRLEHLIKRLAENSIRVA